MIPKECKRLAEVDFPIAVVSKHSAREKSIRHGHPSTLHLWWARRPLAACRAMLMALLLPDPCDSACPEKFRSSARDILIRKHGRPSRWESEVKTDEGLRKILFEFIGEFANWDNSANADFLHTSRALVKAAHPDETPLVVDPFAGGGSIPLEALRLGCEAFASDLNPVACLILKVMLEDIPRHGSELAEELRRVGGEIKLKAEKELAAFYPKDPDGATPIAYLWARTVKCESPNCGAEIPLMRSYWLCSKANRRRALRYKVIRLNGEPPRVEFEVFEPKNENEVPGGTVARAKATCLCCNMVLPPDRVRAQLAEQRGGADAVFDARGGRIGGARMLAVVMLRPGETGRHYRLSNGRDYGATWNAKKRLKGILDEWERDGKKGLCPVPDEPLPPIGTLGFRVQRYGMLKWGDLFTARQKVALVTLARHMAACSNCDHVSADHELLSVVVSRCSSFWSSLNMWVSTGEFVANVFGRQALPIVWDFCEVFPVSTESGGFGGAIDWVARVIEAWPAKSKIGQVQIADATEHPLPGETVSVYFTDPPYYDAIPYSDLSDFFMAWLKRTLYDHPLLRDPFDSTNPLSPKTREVVQDETKRFDGRTKDRAFFEERMEKAFAEGRRILKEDGIGSVVFAHKTTEGWEALLTGMIRGGWTISGSWPIATERPGRLRSQDSAALATSVHLVCRPRPEDAPVGDWGEVLRELPKRVGDWMERLQGEGIRGADLVFACIGPALEIYSRYSKVVDPDEKDIPLGGDPEAKEPYKRGFLAYVWETVGRIALGQVLGTTEANVRSGMAEALEEDARLTALFLWTLQSTNGKEGSNGESTGVIGDDSDDDEDEKDSMPKGMAKGYSLVFDVARRFAQPLGIELPKWEGRIIETKKGIVRLMVVSERAKQLFGEDGAGAVADWLERDPVKNLQQVLFPEFEEDQAPKIRGRGRGRRKVTLDPSAIEGDSMRDATTLDRVHAAMLLQAGGQSNALRALIKAEQERGPDFLRLANALSALYPKNSEEKRLLDAMLLAVPR
jgi:putative DNA methylase